MCLTESIWAQPGAAPQPARRVRWAEPAARVYCGVASHRLSLETENLDAARQLPPMRPRPACTAQPVAALEFAFARAPATLRPAVPAPQGTPGRTLHRCPSAPGPVGGMVRPTAPPQAAQAPDTAIMDPHHQGLRATRAGSGLVRPAAPARGRPRRAASLPVGVSDLGLRPFALRLDPSGNLSDCSSSCGGSAADLAALDAPAGHSGGAGSGAAQPAEFVDAMESLQVCRSSC